MRSQIFPSALILKSKSENEIKKYKSESENQKADNEYLNKKNTAD